MAASNGQRQNFLLVNIVMNLTLLVYLMSGLPDFIAGYCPLAPTQNWQGETPPLSLILAVHWSMYK